MDVVLNFAAIVIPFYSVSTVLVLVLFLWMIFGNVVSGDVMPVFEYVFTSR